MLSRRGPVSSCSLMHAGWQQCRASRRIQRIRGGRGRARDEGEREVVRAGALRARCRETRPRMPASRPQIVAREVPDAPQQRDRNRGIVVGLDDLELRQTVRDDDGALLLVACVHERLHGCRRGRQFGQPRCNRIDLIVLSDHRPRDHVECAVRAMMIDARRRRWRRARSR